MALLPGAYRLAAQSEGFGALERSALVEAGTTTTINLPFELTGVTENITVRDIAPLIRYDQHQVSGLVNRIQIENLPLNGRHFLELAKLEPGAQPITRASSNRTFVPILGQPAGNSGRGTRVTVDGGSIMAVGNGGSAMAFSQEVVQEFQVTSVNLDLSTGLTSGAAVNIATRSGGAQFHGTGIYFFRDHNLSAYPALNRDRTNPDPFFQRRQFGFALGGPVVRDRMFFFTSWERNEQRGVVATNLLEPDFAHLSRITPSPFYGNQFSLRFDGHITNVHTAFVRYSHEGVRSLGPPTPQTTAYPSVWTRQPAWMDQSVLGVTSVFGGTLVNDFRFSYFFVSSSQFPAGEHGCPGCVGAGAPTITVFETDLTVGSSFYQQIVGRRFHVADTVTSLRGKHRIRLGMDWEHNRDGTSTLGNEPATLTLYSPERARLANLTVPSFFRTLDDLLQLPLRTITVEIGSPKIPQSDGGFVHNWPGLRLFIHDIWRANSRLSLNFGLGWNMERRLNYDLHKPALLAPILGENGLGPTRKEWRDFSPVAGLAWALGSNGKAVIRGGAGVYYDFNFGPFPIRNEFCSDHPG